MSLSIIHTYDFDLSLIVNRRRRLPGLKIRSSAVLTTTLCPHVLQEIHEALRTAREEPKRRSHTGFARNRRQNQRAEGQSRPDDRTVQRGEHTPKRKNR